MDHQVYERRLREWRRKMEEKKQGDAPARGQPARGRVLAVISGGQDERVLAAAVARAWGIVGESGEVYVTTTSREAARMLLAMPRPPSMVATSADETAVLTKQLLTDGGHDFIMSVTDTMSFEGNPAALLDDQHDDYVFEVFKTYIPGEQRGQVFVSSLSAERVVGTEVENKCLLTRRRLGGATPMDRICYADMRVMDDVLLKPVAGKSVTGLPLIPARSLDSMAYRKVCAYQYPEGRLATPRYADSSPPAREVVSIIIPTPGRLELLRKCVNSIYSYTVTPFELIIVDNGSNDGTAEYLASEARKHDNFKFTRSQVNLGYQKGINTGASMATGDYLLLFNDDAWVTGIMADGRDWVGALLDDLRSNPKAGMAGVHAADGPVFREKMLYLWCVLLRRETWGKVGPLDDVTFLNYGGDEDYCHRLRQAGYEISDRYNDRLRHLMTCVPDHVKEPQIAEGQRKLREKYGVKA
jgi:hypothetical protein